MSYKERVMSLDEDRDLLDSCCDAMRGAAIDSAAEIAEEADTRVASLLEALEAARDWIDEANEHLGWPEPDIDDVAAGNPRAERDLVNLRRECHSLERELGTASRDYEVMNRIREGVEAERDALLEALEEMFEDGDWIGGEWVPTEQAHAKADAAIAKAYGEK